MDLSNKIGNLLREKRNNANLSLRAAASKVGKTKSTISYYESGKIDIDVVMLEKLCKAYGTDMYSFIDEVKKR